MIEDIEFRDADGYLEVRIDNERHYLDIKEIVRKETEIIALKSFDTPLYEYVDIEAYIFFPQRDGNLPDDLTPDVDEDGNIIYVDDEMGVIDYYHKSDKPVDKGIVTISIYDANQEYLYETETVSFTNGQISYTSKNKYDLGNYTAVINYDGSKYYAPCNFSSKFSVEKRKVICIFDEESYSAYPNELLPIGITLLDEKTSKPISVAIEYAFNNDEFTSFTNDRGRTSISISMPNVDMEFCNDSSLPDGEERNIWAYYNEDTETWDYIDDEDITQGESNEDYYELTINIDSDIYQMETAEVHITNKKIPTEIYAFNVNTDESHDFVFIEGDVLAILPDGETNVQYGQVTIGFDEFEAESVASVNENGHFFINMPVTDIQVLTTNGIDECEIYNDTIIPKETRIKQEINGRIFNQGDELKVTATCTYISNLAEPIPLEEGMVAFVIKDKDTKEEIYRYASELDESGEAVMLFNVSKKGSFDVIIHYYGIFEYKSLTKTGLEYQVL